MMRNWEPRAPSTQLRATPQEMEDAPSHNRRASLSWGLTFRLSAPSTQTKPQDVRKVVREMPWVAEYITGTRRPTMLGSGCNGGHDTPRSSLSRSRQDCLVSPLVAPIDAQVYQTLVRATEQAARPKQTASALCSEHHGTQ